MYIVSQAESVEGVSCFASIPFIEVWISPSVFYISTLRLICQSVSSHAASMPSSSAASAKAAKAAVKELEKRRTMQRIKMDQQLKEKQVEAVEIIDKFCKEFDRDNDGDLDPSEIKELLRRTSKTPPSETALSEAVAKVPKVRSAA